MPAGLSTFWSLPPQPPLWRVFGFSSNDCQISVSSPHLAQRYRYVGIGPALSITLGVAAALMFVSLAAARASYRRERDRFERGE